VSEKRVSEKRVSEKRVSEKRVSEKRVSEKRVSEKRVSEKRVSEKRVSLVTEPAPNPHKTQDQISCFTYLAVLGSGYVVPMLCFLMQFSIPTLLMRAQFRSQNRGEGHNFKCAMSNEVFNDEDARGDFSSLEGALMIFCVLVYYLFKVVPDTMEHFYNTAGTADNLYSKMMSLRKTIFVQGDDSIGQMVGFKLDLYMNTAFECLLYSANLYMIFHTNDILDVILNSLAIEFVHQLDEGFVESNWYDPKKRFIKAGAINLVLQVSTR